MSNYFTSFSCRLDVGASENVDRAIAIAAELETELEAQDVLSLGFEVERDERRPGTIRLSDGDGFGEPETVIAFVLRCAEVFDLTGRWGFVWGLWCSSSRTDGFGGGAHVLDLGARRTLAWMDCDQWLGALLDRPGCRRGPGLTP